MNSNFHSSPPPPLSWLRLLIAVGLVAGLAWAVLPARAADITVTTTADENNSDGDCSLREAILAANDDTPADNCPAGDGPDTIRLPAGTYLLTIPGAGEDDGLTGDLDITDDLTIVGAGKVTTILDANGLDRGLHIQGVTAQISGVTITGGDAGTEFGGGIAAAGEVTLMNSRVRDNVAMAGGGIVAQSSGSLTVIDSRIYDNEAVGLGGGIQAYRPLTVINSLVSGNTGGSGGGIASQNVLVLTNSTLSGNTASSQGGGVSAAGDDGAHLYNVTITDNGAATTGGGIFIAEDTPVTVRNSLIGGNDPLTTNADCDGTLDSRGYNLVEDTTGCTIVGLTTGNLTGTSPLLGSLENNGGPTRTHALLAGSPAIDAGTPAGCLDNFTQITTTDQRGFLRNGRCDIGAYEYDSPGLPTATASPTRTSSPTATATATPTLAATSCPPGPDSPCTPPPPTATPSATHTLGAPATPPQDPDAPWRHYLPLVTQ